MNATDAAQAHERPVDEPDGPDTALPPARSIIDDVRRMRADAEQRDKRQTVLDVIGYQNRLAIIYRFPDEGIERVLRGVERRAQAETPLEKVEGAADILVATAAAVVGRDENGQIVDLLTGEAIPDGELPEHPLRLDRRLAELLGIEVAPEVKGVNRHVCRHLFSPAAMKTGIYEGDLSLIATSTIVYGWLNGADLELEDDLSGE